MSYQEYEADMISRYKEPEIQPVIEEHTEYIKSIIKDQKVMYMGALVQLETNTMPQLNLCIQYLKFGLKSRFIERLCDTNPIVNKLRDSLYCAILSVKMDIENQYLYGPTIRVIFKMLEFYDVIIRSLIELPPYYHRYRYERYIEYCIQSPGLVLLPTFYNIGATDLLKLRPYPFFPVGITTTILHVDEYLQSPAEFFVHDINHVRRMYENNLMDMKKKGFTNPIAYYDTSKTCLDKVMNIITNTLKSGKTITIPTLKDGKIVTKEEYHMDNSFTFDSPIDKGYAQIIKIILFEIIHEDALPIQEDLICSTILRKFGVKTTFPRVTLDGTVIKSVVSGGSILGFVRYKLKYGFLDTVDNVNENIVMLAYRTDKQIYHATRILLLKLCKHTDDNLIILNITDNSGLNLPVNPDIVKHFVPDILEGEYGDFKPSELLELRKEYGLSVDNQFTGVRPLPITEQGDIYSKLGGKKKRKTRRLK
jgi:hypothetical protein